MNKTYDSEKKRENSFIEACEELKTTLSLFFLKKIKDVKKITKKEVNISKKKENKLSIYIIIRLNN